MFPREEGTGLRQRRKEARVIVMKPSRTLQGPQDPHSLTYSHFLFVGNKFHSTSLTFPELQRAYSNSRLSRKGGNASKEKHLRNNSVVLGQDPSSSSRKIQTSLSSPVETEVLTKVEDGHFELSTGFLEHHSVTSPPNNQEEVSTQWKIIKTLIALVSQVAPVVKNPPTMKETQETWVPDWGRFPTEENGNTLQKIPMDGGAWWARVPSLIKNRTPLSGLPFSSSRGSF